MNSWPTLQQWTELAGILSLELLAIFALARLVAFRLRAAQTRKALWQMAVVSMLLVVAGELNGVRGLVSSRRKSEPVSPPSRQVVVTIKDPEGSPFDSASIAEAETSPQMTIPKLKQPSPWRTHIRWPALI